MIDFLVSNLLWTQGFSVLIAILALAIIGWLFFRPILYLSLGFFLFSFYFFRNPERSCSGPLCASQSTLVCPADGKIVGIARNKNNGFDGYSQRVSIFLSPLDVHVQWTPMAGVVERIIYKPGEFAMAFLPKSSELNERNDLVLRNDQDRTILVRQIAGTIARRIVCWVKQGQNITRGEKYGMIRFGSRVDILLPDDVHLEVGIGQKVYGGQTVLGYWKK